MPTNVIMPALGVAQQTGKLLNWLKTEGQSVTKGEPLMEIETDKATVEIEAPGSGTLARVMAKPGDEVPVGHTIALILAPGEAVTQAALRQHPLPEGARTGGGRPATSIPEPPAQPVPQTHHGGGRLLASPAARRIAKEKGVNLATLTGSGPESSVLAEDVLRAAQGRGDRPVARKSRITINRDGHLPMRSCFGANPLRQKTTRPPLGGLGFCIPFSPSFPCSAWERSQFLTTAICVYAFKINCLSYLLFHRVLSDTLFLLRQFAHPDLI